MDICRESTLKTNIRKTRDVKNIFCRKLKYKTKNFKIIYIFYKNSNH